MFIRRHYIAFFILVFVISGLGVWHQSALEKTNFISEIVGTLSQNSNKKIYTAGFTKNNVIPHLFKKDKTDILWIGGNMQINLDGIEKFGTILTSNPLLQYLLKKENIGSYFVPEGYIKEKIIPIKFGKEVIVLGKPPFIENILRTKEISYKQYQWEEVIDHPELVSEAGAIIAEDIMEKSKYFGIPQIIFNASVSGIPILTQWKGEDLYSIFYIFNNNINFYMFEKDALEMIEKILSNDKEIIKRAQKNKEFVNKYFEKQAVIKQISHILFTKENYAYPISDNSMTINISSKVGHYGAGDYWIADDIAHSFDNVDITFRNSVYLFPADIYLRLRGWPSSFDDKKLGNFNILYQLYIGRDIPSEKDFYNDLITSMRVNDIFLSASKKVAEKMQQLGYKSYYLPQFTNINKFYSDYDERLKSEVLFVGNFHFDRTGIVWAIQNNLPITIYGDKYPEGVAKEKYIDNRILRKYYSSAKIVLNDTMPKMRYLGFVSNRIFDATACGTLVISDYMPEIEEIYGNSVPMYKTKEEQKELIKYYLEHEEERVALAKKAQEITIKFFTSDVIVAKLKEIIKTHYPKK